MPTSLYYMERRGHHSDVVDRIRERYQARLLARASPAQQTAESPPAIAPPAGPAGTLEQVRRQARDAWLQMRQERTQQQTAAAAVEPALAKDKDYAL